MTKYTYAQLHAEYLDLWSTMEIKESSLKAINSVADKIIRNRERYEAVSAKTNVPWYFIGVIHNRESSLNFSRHLHNGDALTGKTHRKPAGRPLHAPKNGSTYTWEESAIDALKQKKLHQIKDWSIDRMCYELERYNGFGYRMRNAGNSPYLWSKTNHYVRGKFVRDRVFSYSAVDEQLGTMPVLKIIIDKCADIKAEGKTNVPTYKEVVKNSKTLSRLQKIRLFIRYIIVSMGALFTWDNVMQAKNLVVDNSGWILLGLGTTVLLVMEYTKFIEKQSVESAQRGEWKIMESKENV